MFSKRMYINDGDMGTFVGEQVVGLTETWVNSDGTTTEFDYWKELFENHFVVYNNKEECLKEFNECVFDEDKHFKTDKEYFSNMKRISNVKRMITLLCEKEEGKQGKWFVGGNGEYDVIVGFEFESDNDEQITYYEE